MTEWVLVPREPTAKMVLAAFDAITNASGEGMIRARWRCMLDAAPAEPQQAEPVAWMAFGGSIVHAVTRNAMDPIEAERFDVPLYLHPPAAPQQAEPALNERVGLAYKNGYEEALNDCIRNGGEAWARSMFANGGEHIKPQQAEPVAWVEVLDRDEGPYEFHGQKLLPRGKHSLYLHPPADEVRRLRDALDEIESETQDVSIQQIARKALEGK